MKLYKFDPFQINLILKQFVYTNINFLLSHKMIYFYFK